MVINSHQLSAKDIQERKRTPPRIQLKQIESTDENIEEDDENDGGHQMTKNIKHIPSVPSASYRQQSSLNDSGDFIGHERVQRFDGIDVS